MTGRVSHIFFDLHGTLIDSAVAGQGWADGLEAMMSARYGGEPGAWAEANRLILEDWDSYYADLDLGGDDSIEQMWEGQFRITRALFRLTRTPEPPKAEIAALSREIPGLVTRTRDALYPDARPVLDSLHASGYVLGIASHALAAQAEGLLVGARVRDLFSGPIVGPVEGGHFLKDEAYYLTAAALAGVSPGHCLVVDDSKEGIQGAKLAGMTAIRVFRGGSPVLNTADYTLSGGLSDLPHIVER